MQQDLPLFLAAASVPDLTVAHQGAAGPAGKAAAAAGDHRTGDGSAVSLSLLQLQRIYVKTPPAPFVMASQPVIRFFNPAETDSSSSSSDGMVSAAGSANSIAAAAAAAALHSSGAAAAAAASSLPSKAAPGADRSSSSSSSNRDQQQRVEFSLSSSPPAFSSRSASSVSLRKAVSAAAVLAAAASAAAAASRPAAAAAAACCAASRCFSLFPMAVRPPMGQWAQPSFTSSREHRHRCQALTAPTQLLTVTNSPAEDGPLWPTVPHQTTTPTKVYIVPQQTCVAESVERQQWRSWAPQWRSWAPQWRSWAPQWGLSCREDDDDDGGQLEEHITRHMAHCY